MDDTSSTLPPYPQMIMEAIEAANEVNGINKTAISKHIESTQKTLPPSHNTLLNFHLNQMKQSGQIVMAKNNYMKPDLNAPPKRGRGRPPKPKSDVPIPPPSTSPPRPRGRPPKVKDNTSSESETIEAKSKAAASGSGRGRGRPPKKAKIVESETVKEEEASTEVAEPKRGRGRPPKVKPAMVPVGC